MSETRITIEMTPGGYYFVRIDPPQPQAPMRSFPTLKAAKEYKWRLELQFSKDDEAPEAA